MVSFLWFRNARAVPLTDTVKYGSDYIYNPQQEQPDVLLAMNEESFRMFMPIVAPAVFVSSATWLPATQTFVTM